MPFYDRRCPACGWTAIDVLEPVTTPAVACPTCAQATERAWLTKQSTVIGDECDFIQHNGTREPIRFRSRSAFKRWLKANEYHIRDQHVPEAGSDKSKYTTNWGQVYDQYTAENVRILLERAFKATPRVEEPPLDMHITTYTGELTAEEAKRYAARQR